MTATELKNLIMAQLAAAGLTTDQRNDDLWLAVSQAFVLAGIIGDIMLPINESDVINLVADLAAKANAATTVNGHSLAANITLTKTDIGLPNVDNTSDVNKPISTATGIAINGLSPLFSQVAGNLPSSDNTTPIGIGSISVTPGPWFIDSQHQFSADALGGVSVSLALEYGCTVNAAQCFFTGTIVQIYPSVSTVAIKTMDFGSSNSVGAIGPTAGIVLVRGVIEVTVAGVLAFYFHKATASGGNSVVYQGSYIKAGIT